MADLTRVGTLARAETGLCVVTTLRQDGTPHATVVNAGVLAHPDGGQEVVAFVTRGRARKHENLRVRPRCTLTFRRGWQWATAEGTAELVGPDDPAGWLPPDGLAGLLRDVFVAAGGTHDDWDEYDRVMRQERRLAVLVHVDRAYGPA